MRLLLCAAGLIVAVTVPGTRPIPAAEGGATAEGAHDRHGVHEATGTDPEDWSPEQQEFADDLVARTEVALEQYRDPAVLRSLGFNWVFHGEPGGYVHWINLRWFDDGRILDPEYPESLVYRDTPDGLVLEAAMFSLPFGEDLSTIPEDLAFLPRWHIHATPVCFDDLGSPTGISEDDVCPPGDEAVVLPPMVHVWTVDTQCGRFAGVDDRGLLTCQLDPVIEA